LAPRAALTSAGPNICDTLTSRYATKVATGFARRTRSERYLRATLGLLGLTDLDVIAAERQKMGPQQQALGSKVAERRIEELVG
jgi:FMN-dependent NADH-azoreductase